MWHLVDPQVRHFIAVERDIKMSQAIAEKQSALAVLKEQMQIAEASKMAEIKRQEEEDERHTRQAAEVEAERTRQIELEK
jgi:peptidyl-tRNA hydrolase